eukprot:g26495.t1
MVDMLGVSVEEAMSLFTSSPSTPSKKLFGKASHTLATELTLPAAQTRPIPIQARGSVPLEDLTRLCFEVQDEHRGDEELVACQKSKALELASGRGKVSIGSKQEERLQKDWPSWVFPSNSTAQYNSAGTSKKDKKKDK